MLSSKDIIHRYNSQSNAPDKLEFKHPLSDEWFKSLSFCSLDYTREFYEQCGIIEEYNEEKN